MRFCRLNKRQLREFPPQRCVRRGLANFSKPRWIVASNSFAGSNRLLPEETKVNLCA
jgi:hypothetical protein